MWVLQNTFFLQDLSSLACVLHLLLQGGTSNAGFWHSSNEQEFSRTPLGVNEYRCAHTMSLRTFA